MGRGGRTAILLAALLALCAAAPLAASAAAGTATPPSRAEFVEAADHICEVPYRKGLRLLGKADVQEEQGDLKPAGKKVMRAGRMFLDVNERLSNLEPPTADATLVEAWLNGTHDGFVQVVKSGRKLKAGRVRGADRMLKRAQRTTRRANKKVAALGFNFCA